jgi:5-methylcytosine-specific restriction protein A
MFNLFGGYFGRSSSWPRVRKEHLKNQPFCQACGRKDNLEVHHIEPYHKNPGRELDPENLITLCGKSCHLVFGHLMDYKSWNKDVMEDCSQYLSKLQQRPYHESHYQKPVNHNWFIAFFRNLLFWNN